MIRKKIEFQGKNEWVWFSKSKSTLWLHIAGRTYCFEKQQRQHDTQGGVEKNEIHSPMPGKILNVLCSVGDSVKKSQVTIIMEAMKMEYSLQASRDGVIEELFCRPGDQVSKDQLLLKIKPNETQMKV